MIWFDIIKLEKKLIDGDLSEKEGFNYVFALLIIAAIGRYMSSVADDYENNWFLLVEAGVLISILTAQLIATFKINRNGDGKDFVKRYVCLAVVIRIRLAIYSLAIGVPVVIILAVAGKEMGILQNIKDFVKLVIPIILVTINYFMLTNSFKRVNNRNNLFRNG
jgi:hypothetical protein